MEQLLTMDQNSQPIADGGLHYPYLSDFVKPGTFCQRVAWLSL
jgi:hypothetical protein